MMKPTKIQLEHSLSKIKQHKQNIGMHKEIIFNDHTTLVIASIFGTAFILRKSLFPVFFRISRFFAPKIRSLYFTLFSLDSIKKLLKLDN